ncbi:MAG: tetratricopeptide repeat protein [Deltaproteobacteria bacterium]|nr:tetratricopeptide repeat protein [Deltaproteobacteria bacterium]
MAPKHEPTNWVKMNQDYKRMPSFEANQTSVSVSSDRGEVDGENNVRIRGLRNQKGTLAPGELDMVLEFGRCMTSLGKYPEAVEYYRRALLIDPDCYEARLQLAEISIQRGDLTKALRMLYRISCDYHDQAEPFIQYAEVLKRMGRLEDAERIENKIRRSVTPPVDGSRSRSLVREQMMELEWRMPVPLTRDNVTSAKAENISLDDLLVAEAKIIEGRGTTLVPKRITESVPYNFLLGDAENFIKYNEQFGKREYCIEDFKKLVQSIVNNGYPYNDEYICVANDEIVIRDGRHRAAILRYLWGDRIIPVIRFTTLLTLDSWMPDEDGLAINSGEENPLYAW